jgi:hypothetical protein
LSRKVMWWSCSGNERAWARIGAEGAGEESMVKHVLRTPTSDCVREVGEGVERDVIL